MRNSGSAGPRFRAFIGHENQSRYYNLDALMDDAEPTCSLRELPKFHRIQIHSSDPPERLAPGDEAPHPGLSDFLCVEPYTALEGEELVWRRTTTRSFPRSCWISCWPGVTRRARWIPAV